MCQNHHGLTLQVDGKCLYLTHPNTMKGTKCNVKRLWQDHTGDKSFQLLSFVEKQLVMPLSVCTSQCAMLKEGC